MEAVDLCVVSFADLYLYLVVVFDAIAVEIVDFELDYSDDVAAVIQ